MLQNMIVCSAKVGKQTKEKKLKTMNKKNE